MCNRIQKYEEMVKLRLREFLIVKTYHMLFNKSKNIFPILSYRILKYGKYIIHAQASYAVPQKLSFLNKKLFIWYVLLFLGLFTCQK